MGNGGLTIVQAMKQMKHTHTRMHAGACVHTHTHAHTHTYTPHTHTHTCTHTQQQQHNLTDTHTTMKKKKNTDKEQNQMKERQRQTEGSTDLPLRFQCLQHGFLGILVLLFLHLFIMLQHQSTATSSPPFNATDPLFKFNVAFCPQRPD